MNCLREWWWRAIERPFWLLRCWVHRANHGWSDRDLWSLDDYLAEVIAGALTRHIQTNMGHPADTTEEAWDAELAKGAALFTQLAADDEFQFMPEGWEGRVVGPTTSDDLGRSLKQYESLKDEALDWLKENWFALWE